MKLFMVLAIALFTQVTLADVSMVAIKPAKTVFKDGVKTDLVGTINIDMANEKITVSLFNDICGQLFPSGHIGCMAAAILVEQFEVPLLNVEDSCGSKVYSGEMNKLPVDGNRTYITVIDNTQRRCKDLRPATVETTVSVTYGWNAGSVKYLLHSEPRF